MDAFCKCNDFAANRIPVCSYPFNPSLLLHSLPAVIDCQQQGLLNTLEALDKL